MTVIEHTGEGRRDRREELVPRCGTGRRFMELYVVPKFYEERLSTNVNVGPR